MRSVDTFLLVSSLVMRLFPYTERASEAASFAARGL